MTTTQEDIDRKLANINVLYSENPYVTYKWLLATALSLLGISLTFIYFTFASITRAMESKADIKWVELRAQMNTTRIDVLCTQLDKMEDKQDEMIKGVNSIKSLMKENHGLDISKKTR